MTARAYTEDQLVERPAIGLYGPTYYAAFLTDLDGNNVEAVCMR